MKRLIAILIITTLITVPLSFGLNRQLKTKGIYKKEYIKINENKFRLTCYRANIYECDNTPDKTASGFKITNDCYKNHRVLAICRKLREKLGLKFGDRIKIKSEDGYEIEGYIEDITAKKTKNTIDILISEYEKGFLKKGVSILKVKIKFVGFEVI